jgi:hypothetical protein
MTKTQREEWDKMIDAIHQDWIDNESIKLDILAAANTHIMKLERELQALKNKKTMAALLMKKA